MIIVLHCLLYVQLSTLRVVCVYCMACMVLIPESNPHCFIPSCTLLANIFFLMEMSIALIYLDTVLVLIKHSFHQHYYLVFLKQIFLNSVHSFYLIYRSILYGVGRKEVQHNIWIKKPWAVPPSYLRPVFYFFLFYSALDRVSWNVTIF